MECTIGAFRVLEAKWPAQFRGESSRKQFGATGASAAFGAERRFGGGSLCLGAGWRKSPHVNFPKAARDRLAVAAWPFRAFIDSPTNSDRDPKSLAWT